MKFTKNKRQNFAKTDVHPQRAAKEKHLAEEISRQNSNRLLVKPGEKWFDLLPKDVGKRSPETSETTLSIKTEAQSLLNEDVKLYNKYQDKKHDKDFLWIKKILQSGTLSDKVSAYTLLIQDSPIHNLHNVEILVGMVNIKGKRECLMSVDALQELFVSELLPEERKLRPFNEQPLADIDKLSNNDVIVRKRLLVLWLYEDKLKALYKKFLNNLDLVSRDTVEKTKQKAVTVMYKLLKENPEQEQFLLEHLVNKIGDPLAKVGSHVCYLLGQLLDHHTNMNGIVMQEVERLLFRPNVSERTKYYCLCFLNQIILCHDEYELANHLISIYFGQFKVCIKNGEVNTKMMSALLTGVARAYPYAKLKENILMEQLDAMYRLVHMVNFNISIQALMLIFQVLDSSDSISDRFYCTLYRKLSDPAFSNSSRQSALLNLVYRALKIDVSSVRVKAFVKRLLQVALYQAPNLQSGILILISEVAKIHSNLLDYKQLNSFSDSDSDEHYDDVPDEEDVKEQTGDTKPDVSPTKNLRQTHSWVHKQQRVKKTKSKNGYDPDARNPLHSGTEFTNLWELLFLKKSFHPSVALFAHQVTNSKDIKYSGDPLLDFTTARFLDRFVYRNPKKQSESWISDTHRKVFGSRKLKSANSKHVPINSEDFIQQSLDKVPVEERFIYQYLRQRNSEGKSKKHDSDIESVCSDDFENILNEIHPEDEGKSAINIAKELQLHKQKKSSKRKVESDSDSLEGESDFEDELGFEDDDDFQNAFGDLDKDVQNLDDNVLCEEDFVDVGDDEMGSSKPRKKKAKISKGSNRDSLFASADEFSALLEDNAGSKVDTLTANALSNKDKSGAKQLAWERQRDQYVKGRDWKSKKNNKFKKRPKFTKKK